MAGRMLSARDWLMDPNLKLVGFRVANPRWYHQHRQLDRQLQRLGSQRKRLAATLSQKLQQISHNGQCTRWRRSKVRGLRCGCFFSLTLTRQERATRSDEQLQR
jgi:hypothetical protein